jgi:hypothetical protein
MTHKRFDGGPYTWADIEIKIDPNAEPMTEIVSVPGSVEYDAVLTARLDDLPDEIRGELLNGDTVLSPALYAALCNGPRPSSPPLVCVRLFDANNALVPRTGCYCNTIDCPHRPAKGA